MLAEILRTKQALLLGGDGRKVHRMRRTLGRLRVCPSQFEKDAAAGAIVGGTIVDAIALRIRIDAEMIVMRGIEHSVFRTRGRTGHATDNVG